MATFKFNRYIDGTLMAEGVTVDGQPDLQSAMPFAAHLAARGPKGQVPVLILREIVPGGGDTPAEVAGSAWRDVPVTMPFLADLFDAYCGADGHNLVVAEAHRVLGKKL